MKAFGCIKRGLIALLLLSAVGILAIRFTPRERNLLEHATKVTDVSTWWDMTAPLSEPYTWLSDHVLFSHSGWWRLSDPFTFDIRTGKKTPITRLSTLLSQDDNGSAWSWELSPDRQWLLWTFEFRDDVYVAKLDGSHYKKGTLPGPGTNAAVIGWQADNRHWFVNHYRWGESEKNSRLFKGDVDSPGQLRAASEEEMNELLADPDVISPFQTNTDFDNMVEEHISSAWPSDREIVLQPPKDTQVIEVVTDDIGNRLLWLCTVTRQPTFTDRIMRLVPGYKVPPPSYLEMRVSRGDSTDMHPIGYFATSTDRMDILDVGPYQLRWLPDGKRVSFVYKGMLYIVPVD